MELQIPTGRWRVSLSFLPSWWLFSLFSYTKDRHGGTTSTDSSPFYFWEEVFARRKALIAGRQIVLGHVQSFSGYLSFGLQLLAFLGVLEALVQSYFHREILTVCFASGALWPLAYGLSFVRNHAFLTATWALGCGLMSTFTLLPVVKMEDLTSM